jgi:hypothetical protein
MNRKKLLKLGKIVGVTIVCIFALIGLVLVGGYVALQLGFTKVPGIIDQQRQAFLGTATTTDPGANAPTYPNGTPWQNTQQWDVLSEAITNDASVINQAATVAGVPARLIVANLIVEQLRLFFTERGYYEQFFAPLKILGSQTQFSLGVMGMKDDTAAEVEANLKDPTSPYYPGAQYANLLDYSTASSTASSTSPVSSTTIESERFARLTDQHNHYYSYLYAGLYFKEIEAQWQTADFSITNNIGVLSTLYNIGFTHSMPNANPQIGGAAIVINGVTYSFGGLADQFYTSNLLTNLFPAQ